MIEGALIEILGRLQVPTIGKNSKGWLVARCPFAEFLHDRGTDKNPSFFIRVNPTGASGFNCFTCKQRGTISTLARKLGRHRGEDYHALAIDADLAEATDDWQPYDDANNHTVEEAVPIPEEVFAGMFDTIGQSPRAKSYLRGRNIGPTTSRTLGLKYDASAKRVVFPVRDRGSKLYGYTGRSVLPNPEMKVKDYGGLKKEQLLLGEQLVRPGKPILVVEGLFALARVVEVGGLDLCSPVATMGSRMSVYQADRILDMGEPVFILYDDDEAGRIGVYGGTDSKGGEHSSSVVKLLATEISLRVCSYPEGLSDVDSMTFEQLEWMLSKEGSTLEIL
jgi:hypothetical protein